MQHHQRIHHRSRSLSSPFDSPPRHSPPHDPHYAYHQPYAASTAATRPCPHCRAPPTSFHMDTLSGDLICTQCGAVLDDHLRDETAEWREYDNVEDLAKGKGPGGRVRCGELVDESRHAGGLAPTRLSAGVYQPHGIGGTGSGAGAGMAEEKHRLGIVRGRLKRMHNVIENLVEQEQKGRYADMVLERRARDARVGRGEDVMEDGNNNIGGEGGINVDLDNEGLMMKRNPLQEPEHVVLAIAKTPSSSSSSLLHDRERAFQSLKGKKWSLPDAVLLYGMAHQVKHYSNPTDPTGGEWTQTSLEAERFAHSKKFDVSAHSSLHKLCTAFSILEKAATKLQMHGPSNQTFREAVGWLLEFAAKNDGLRVKGISGGSYPFASGEKDADKRTLSFSLLGAGEAMTAAPPPPSRMSSSPATRLHRLRQYASLGAAILYVSAKRTGVGRTLTEVCSAFGTYALVETDGGGGASADAEPFVRPKHCSRAMQALRAALPEVVAPLAGGGAGLPALQNVATAAPSVGERGVPPPLQDVGTASLLTSSSSGLSTSGLSTEDEKMKATSAKVTRTHLSDSAAALSPVPVKSGSDPSAARSASRNGSNAVKIAEVAALSDLVARMAAALDLPPSVASAAAAVAVRCARDARASAPTKSPPPPPRRSVGKGHVRPRKRSKAIHISTNDAPSPGVVAVSALLLVCTAGGTMQRLARQALRHTNDVAPPSSGSRTCKITSGGAAADSMSNPSNPLDDLHEDLTSPPKSDTVITSSPVETGTAGARRNGKVQRRHLPSWTAWDAQPPWRRDLSRMERSTGVPRRAVVRFYGRELHPRRTYFLETAGEGGLPLLQDMVAAAPLMSLRDL